MTVEKWNNLTPTQRGKANELLKQAQFDEFEKYLDACNTEQTEDNEQREEREDECITK